MKGGRGGRDRLVKRQYADFPYPPRNPLDEQKRLITGSPSHLDELNHYIFAGARDFSAPFSALVAGGGTGDAAIMLAQQLADRGPAGHVTYLDLSAASRRIAEASAEARGLKNITFLSGSLLDLPSMGIGPFDYIDCCRVLHHLEEHEAGLAALAAVLQDCGGLGLMVYATLGRTGVYPVQEALKMLAGDAPTGEQVKVAKHLLRDLSPGHWLKRNPVLGDHKLDDDAALYDLLLHPRDRSYLVGELFDLLATAEMELLGFIEPVRYEPELYLKEPELRKRARNLSPEARAALAENLAGTLKTHSFYIRKIGGSAPGVAAFDPDMIPFLRDGNPAPLAAALAGRETLTVPFDGQPIEIAVPEGSADFVRQLDGTRRLRDIQTAFSLSWPNFRARFAPVYKMLNGLNLLWLRKF